MVESQGDIDEGRYEFNKFNRWLAAEYNTAVARSRTAKQWSEWDSSEERSLFPNIMWLPSRSATLREQHIPFYNRVWAKDDPFWNHNQPGTLWNCKCDWQQTDEPVTPNNPNKTVRNQGLEGNPAKTGKIFTDEASYIKKSANPKIVEEFYKPIDNAFADYQKYSKDKNYNNVKIRWENGGFRATHDDHNFDEKTGVYEKNFQEIAFNQGHRVILGKEKGLPDGMKYQEGKIDGLSFEIASSIGIGKNNIKGKLQHCRSKNAEVAVVYFPDKKDFSMERMIKGVSMYSNIEKHKFTHIIYVVDGKMYYYK